MNTFNETEFQEWYKSTCKPRPTKITIDNYAEKAPELVAYMQSVAQKHNDTLSSFGDITVMFCDEVNRWDIEIKYEPGENFYSFSNDKVFAELLQDVVNKFCNEPFGLNIIVKPCPIISANGDLSLAILPGFNSEAEFQEWRKSTKYMHKLMNTLSKQLMWDNVVRS